LDQISCQSDFQPSRYWRKKIKLLLFLSFFSEKITRRQFLSFGCLLFTYLHICTYVRMHVGQSMYAHRFGALNVWIESKIGSIQNVERQNAEQQIAEMAKGRNVIYSTDPTWQPDAGTRCPVQMLGNSQIVCWSGNKSYKIAISTVWRIDKNVPFSTFCLSAIWIWANWNTTKITPKISNYLKASSIKKYVYLYCTAIEQT
jgi:hypothetical protein